MTQRRLLVLLAVFLCAARGEAYGPNGHRIVGAIADERLANTETGRRIRSLLEGFSLEKAAVIPDEIKGWDKKGVDAEGMFRYKSRPKMDEQLAAFWRANPPTYDKDSEAPNHHWFHYTDVPLEGGQRYADGKAGRSKWDIVQMISYCVRVLQGEEPEDNPRKITKPIAIVLLAHMGGIFTSRCTLARSFSIAKAIRWTPTRTRRALIITAGTRSSSAIHPSCGSAPASGKRTCTASGITWRWRSASRS